MARIAPHGVGRWFAPLQAGGGAAFPWRGCRAVSRRATHGRPPRAGHGLRRAQACAVWRGWASSLAAQAALAGLLLALVVVPALGRWHQVSHGSALDRLHAGQPVAADPAPSLTSLGALRPPGRAPSWLGVLLGKHTPVECQLLDQLALGDALQAATTLGAMPAPQHAPPVQRSDRLHAVHVALYLARGPPAA